MFLNRLEYNEKCAFLGLALELKSIDGIESQEETDLINAYCEEMGISIDDAKPIYESDLNKSEESEAIGEAAVTKRWYFQFNEKNANALDILINAVKENKRIIIVELLGLAFSNYEYHEKEEAFVKKVAERLDIETEIYDNLKDCVERYHDIVDEIDTTLKVEL